MSLTADLDTGSYVFDLVTGDYRRITPPLPLYHAAYSNYFVHSWSADGKWIAITKNEWHNPTTYDYELNDIILFASDGSEIIPLTYDGLCQHGAIRPTAPHTIPNGESELTLQWAKLVRGQPGTASAGIARAAQVRVDITVGPPFVILLQVQTPEGIEYPEILDCTDIPDGFAKLDKFLSVNQYETAGDFTIVFPRYAFDDPKHDHTVRYVTDLVYEETTNRGWLFDREVPNELQ